MTEPEPTYDCPLCGRRNLSRSEMIFQATSHDNRWRPHACRHCYDQVQEREERQRQEQWEKQARTKDIGTGEESQD